MGLFVLNLQLWINGERPVELQYNIPESLGDPRLNFCAGLSGAAVVIIEWECTGTLQRLLS